MSLNHRLILILAAALLLGVESSCSHKPKIEYLSQSVLDIKDTSGRGLYVSNEEITIVLNERTKQLEIYTPYGLLDIDNSGRYAADMFFVSSIGDTKYLDYELLGANKSENPQCHLSIRSSYDFVAKHIRHYGYIIITPFIYNDILDWDSVTLIIPCGNKWSEYEDRITVKRAVFTASKEMYKIILSNAPEYADTKMYCESEKVFFLLSRMSNPKDYMAVLFSKLDADVEKKKCTILFRCSDKNLFDWPQSEVELDDNEYVTVSLGPDSALSAGASILEESFDFWGSLLSGSGSYSESNRRGTLLDEECFSLRIYPSEDPVYESEKFCLVESEELYSRIVDIFTNTYTTQCRITIPMVKYQNGVSIKYNKNITVVKDSRLCLY